MKTCDRGLPIPCSFYQVQESIVGTMPIQLPTFEYAAGHFLRVAHQQRRTTMVYSWFPGSVLSQRHQGSYQAVGCSSASAHLVCNPQQVVTIAMEAHTSKSLAACATCRQRNLCIHGTEVISPSYSATMPPRDLQTQSNCPMYAHCGFSPI